MSTTKRKPVAARAARAARAPKAPLGWAEAEQACDTLQHLLATLYPNLTLEPLAVYRDALHAALAPDTADTPDTALAAPIPAPFPAPFPAPLPEPPLVVAQAARIIEEAREHDGEPLPDAPAYYDVPEDELQRWKAQAVARGLLGDTPDRWSRYQLLVFHFVATQQGRNGQISAVAGSGKTTTIVQAARFIAEPAIFCAFNAHIADELQRRLAGTSVTVKTIHSLGMAALRKHVTACGRKLGRVNEQKYKKLAEWPVADLQRRLHVKPEDGASVAAAVKQLVQMARVNLVDPRDDAAMRDLCDKYDVALFPEWYTPVFECVDEILRAGMRAFDPERTPAPDIDFTDMIWLPCVMNLPAETQYGWVLVDECQDLSLAQQEIVARARKPSGRLLAVGDRRQAIYGFAGADAESFERLGARFGCTPLRLTINYRCPADVVRLAQQYCPELEPRPDAPQGVVDDLKESQLAVTLQPGDLVLCRMTAPIVALCMRLIARHVPAKVRGRDVGRQIAAVIEEVEKFWRETHPQPLEWTAFGDALAEYQSTMVDRLMSRDDAESRIQSLTDKCEALRTVYEGYHASSAAMLVEMINALFYDEKKQAEKPAIALSTVHRAKGLEEQRVFIYKPDKLPLSWPRQKDWEAVQEQNLAYVAYTRPMAALYFVQEDQERA